MREHKVLIVDDEEYILNSLKRLLRNEKYAVLTTVSPQEAIEIVSREKISLIIVDYRMPQLNGVELLKKIKAVSEDTLRIILTGYTDTQIAVQAINEGEVYRFISKPWNDDELKIIISQALAQYDLFMDNKELLEMVQKNQYILSQIRKEHPEIEIKEMPQAQEGKYVIEGRIVSLEDYMKRYFSR